MRSEGYRFEIPGDPVGYTTTTFKSKHADKRFQKYGNYCKEARRIARHHGLEIPLVATKDKPLLIKTIAYFRNGVHCDPGNVQKGITDALFYDENKIRMVKTKRGPKMKTGGKGDDKYTGGAFPPPRYDKKNPRVIVIIKPYNQEKSK